MINAACNKHVLFIIIYINMKHLFKLLIPAIIITSFVFVPSCTKYEAPVDPLIGNSGLPGNTTTLDVGQSVVLKPALGAGDRPITIIWKRDGQIVSRDFTYTFTATAYGEYKVQYLVQNASGSATVEYTIIVKAPYQDGFFLFNEGWFGHDNGSINFWHTGTDTIETDVFVKNNPGKALGLSTQSGSVYKGNVYMVSKQGPLVAANALTMKEAGRIAMLPAEGRSFLGIDANAALLSTADGVYRLTLSPLAVGDKIAGIDGEAGNMIKSGNRVFVFTQDKGVVVINSGTWTVEKEVGAAVDAFVESNDGGIWYAYTNGLVKLDPSTLEADTIPVNVAIPNVYVYSAYYAGSLTYSKEQNAIYFLNDGGFTGSNIVYRYNIGDVSFSDEPFITVPANRVFYSSGIRVNPATDELIATTVQTGFGDNYQVNDLTFYNTSTGAQIKKIAYTGYWFPALPVFHEAD